MPRDKFLVLLQSRVQTDSQRSLEKQRDRLIQQLQSKSAKARGSPVKLHKETATMYRSMLAVIEAEIEKRDRQNSAN